jgi:hypothetical protein
MKLVRIDDTFLNPETVCLVEALTSATEREMGFQSSIEFVNGKSQAFRASRDEIVEILSSVE